MIKLYNTVWIVTKKLLMMKPLKDVWNVLMILLFSRRKKICTYRCTKVYVPKLFKKKQKTFLGDYVFSSHRVIYICLSLFPVLRIFFFLSSCLKKVREMHLNGLIIKTIFKKCMLRCLFRSFPLISGLYN